MTSPESGAWYRMVNVTVTLIAAVSADGFISRGTGVPWDLPKDKAHFRTYTQGKWVLLGRKTYEEMIGWFGDRHPLILTRRESFFPEVGERVFSVEMAIDRAAAENQPELVVLGGGEIFQASSEFADRLVITHVHQFLGGGVAFPEIHADDWEPVETVSYVADEQHAQAFEIVTYQRIQRLERAA